MIGHIKIDRKILNWEWYTDIKVFHYFLYLLLKANHKDGKWQGVDIKRGQLITGRLKCSRDTGLTEREIRTCTDKLKTTNEITVKTTNKFSVITICKYDYYQSNNYTSDQQNDQQNANKRPTNDQQTTTNNNVNNDKNVKKEEEEVDFVFWEVEKNNFLRSGDWIFNFCRGKDIKLEEFDKKAKIFISDLELKEDYKTVKGLKKHFTNWYNLNKKNEFKINNWNGHQKDPETSIKKEDEVDYSKYLKKKPSGV